MSKSKSKRTKECPVCRRLIAVHDDGSFVMHAGPGGGLCNGTNCRTFDRASLRIGGISIPVIRAWEDPDADMDSV